MFRTVSYARTLTLSYRKLRTHVAVDGSARLLDPGALRSNVPRMTGSRSLQASGRYLSHLRRVGGHTARPVSCAGSDEGESSERNTSMRLAISAIVGNL